MKHLTWLLIGTLVACANDAPTVDWEAELTTLRSESEVGESGDSWCTINFGDDWQQHPQTPEGLESCLQTSASSRVVGAIRQSRNVCQVTCECELSWSETSTTCPVGSKTASHGEVTPIPFCQESETFPITRPPIDVTSAVCETTARAIKAHCEAECRQVTKEIERRVDCCVRRDAGDSPSHI